VTDSTPKRPQWLDVTFFGLFLVCLLIGFGTGLGWRDTCFRGRPDLRPTYSHRPGKRNVAAVFALNILLGWSLLGASGPALRVRRGEI
jgi:hypothetical protein